MGPIKTFNNIRIEFFTGIIIAALASAGLSSLIEGIEFESKWYYTKSIIIIIIFCFVFLFYFLIYYRARRVDISTNAIFVVKKNGNLMNMPGYTFSCSICNILTTALRENKAFMKRWLTVFEKEQEERRKIKIVDEINTHIPNDYTYVLKIDHELKNNDASLLLKDSIECDFLEWLSRFLSDSYRNQENIIKVNRDKISSYLLKNKVLELISKDFSDRPAFKDINIDTKYIQHIVSLCDTKTNIEYNQFELIFPDKTTIERDEHGILIIKNNYFKMKFSTCNGLVNGLLPSGYPELILKCDSKEINVYNVPVSLSIVFDAKKFAFGHHDSKYDWIDDLVEQFESHYSVNKYIDKIGFYAARTMVSIFNQKDKTCKND